MSARTASSESVGRSQVKGCSYGKSSKQSGYWRLRDAPCSTLHRFDSDNAATKTSQQAPIHVSTLPPVVGIRCESRFNDDPELPPLNPESAAEVNA
jgi:hypothetical protein